jgi:hypothetical protein
MKNIVRILLLIAFVMLSRKRSKKKLEHYMFAFFNGLLIFVNASGLNAITSKSNWNGNVNSIEQSNLEQIKMQESTFFITDLSLFKNNVSWWENDKIYRENLNLKLENELLSKTNSSLKNEKKLLIRKNDSLIKDLRHSTGILGRSSSILWDLKEFVDKINPNLRSEEQAAFFIRFRILEEKIRGDYEYLSETVSKLPVIKDENNWIVIVESNVSMYDLSETYALLKSIYGKDQIAIYKDVNNIYALAVKGNGSFTRAYRLNIELRDEHDINGAYFRGIKNWGEDYSKEIYELP